MKRFLEELFYKQLQEVLKSNSINMLDTEIERNKEQLKANLNKKQKKLLLRFEDSKDLIKEESGYESFVAGFKIDLKIGYETNKD
ncbi:DUF6809 family protein [Anaeropeptidivorans aminofermentans]|uniref:DUF6809 family protein n=1 Tax=Anaeropeptidivorans aminofermentans TaxID=2934315 RepID=UPI002B1F978A|nr:DUF6809 family protein [Anaeropeptidivorans aminofermentans]